tara:strand:- start:2220 stop:3005 length:786 start_codon:yes stop_codon:yes gene_type:complete
MSVLDEKYQFEERFVAFIDILGFTKIIEELERNKENEYGLQTVKSILNFMDEESFNPNYSVDLPIYVLENGKLIEKELGDPRLTYISDCIIISTEPSLDGFKALSRKIHKIIADLAYDGFFCRGAITKGRLFHHNRILFGTAYMKAYLLEETKALYPRIIIDPDIIDFFNLEDEEMPLSSGFYGLDEDGFYYLRYWTWQLFPPYAGSFENYMSIVLKKIGQLRRKYDETPKIKEKYDWLMKEHYSLTEWWIKAFDEKYKQR